MAAGAGQRAFTVQDAIELSSIVDYSAAEEGVLRVAPIVSPDRRSFLLITERGHLAGDRIESTIWLFDRQAAADFVLHRSAARPVPRALATLSATSNLPVISGVRWLADSARVAFLGKDGSPYQRLFIADVKTGAWTAVTGNDAFVSAYDIRGDTIAYTTVVPPARAAAPTDEMVVVSPKSLASLLYPEPLGLEDAEWESLGGYAAVLHVRRHGSELPLAFRFGGKPLKLFPTSWSLSVPLAISPDESSLITLAPVPEIPPGWEAYPPQPDMGGPRLVPGDRQAVAEDNFYKPQQFVRVDLRTGQASPLVDAPAARSLGYMAPATAFWLADSRRAILCNTFLPRAAGPVIAVVDVATRAPEAVKPLALPAVREARSYDVEDIAWDAAKEEMTLSYAGSRQPPPPETFGLRSGEWIRLPAPARASADGVELAVEEAFDRSPVLSGRRPGDAAAAIVWDPNPQLAGLALGKVSPYRWQDRNGVSWAGLLALPPNRDPKRRYPLVIQTHGYRLDQYFVDGQFTTGSGGRALVARGVVVLQMDMPSTHIFTPADAPFQLDGFQAAVAHLAADGLIDPRRVGVIGFSFTCFHTLYALTHDPQLFAAAAITDGNNMSYTQYIYAQEGVERELAEEVNGGTPWGRGLASWTARSPDFNLDKVQAPLLISAFERFQLLRQYEPYAGLSRLKKPVEMLWLRRENAPHVLRRPLHRYLSQQSAVDWFDFWLNGHEDPDPAKAGQYARWRELRKLKPQ